ncbi:MAG: hypothetical protein V4676_13485, partial [Bacteroidota bacterium]
HLPAQNYTPKQTAILSALAAEQLAEGGYYMPGMPEGTSMDEHKKMMLESEGKPWALVQYHHKFENNMLMNMVRGFLTNVLMLFLFTWILLRLGKITIGKTVTACLITGMIVFLNGAYTNFIWYQTFDIWAHLADAVVSWGLTGVWLGWWFRNKGRNTTTV